MTIHTEYKSFKVIKNRGIYRFLPHVSILSMLLLGFLALPATAQTVDPRDPWEGFNRKVFAVNEVLDKVILKPVARFYNRVVPSWGKTGIRNFIRNIRTPLSVVNATLKWDWHAVGRQITRFSINSTIGVAGIFDVAAKMGLPPKQVGFDQTLASWGVPLGPYLVLPVLPPKALRGHTSQAAELTLDPVRHTPKIDTFEAQVGITFFDVIDARAQLLAGEAFLSGDRYTALRELYFSKHRLEGQSGSDTDESVTEDDFGFDDFDDSF